MKKFFQNYGGRKLWAGIVASVISFVNAYFQLGLDVKQMIITISPLLAFMGIEGMADMLERWAKGGQLGKISDNANEVADIAKDLLGEGEEDNQQKKEEE